ncbi:DDHD domain-containing protein [Gautieria morchelliformis]|nr:DDHD domain-containing protein [Gautieria morchelliformis]
MQSDAANAPPSISVRWFRPTMSTPFLQLPTAPISVTNIDSWIALSIQESAQCEEAWHALSDEQRHAAEASCSEDYQPGPLEELGEEESTVGVTLSEDRLFEVDVKSMEAGHSLMILRPIYWRLTSPLIKVRRAVWMYDETRPAPKPLAEQLDAAYHLIQPWQPSYNFELETAARLGVEAFEKLKYPLTLSPLTGTSRPFVIFEDAFTARITSSTNNFFPNSFFGSRNRRAKTGAFTFSGTPVFYGYDTALARTLSKSSPQNSRPLQGKQEEAAAVRNSLGAAIDIHPPSSANMSAPEYSEIHSNTADGKRLLVEDNGPQRVTDLVLVVHGIGQGLASQYESWSFLYAVNNFRQLAKKQATLPALASILREKQVQFLPVQWRTSLNIGEEEQRERERDGLGNTFSIAGTTYLTIPAIRELTNNVLIEVPYFMSHHQTAMIESVCMQANRTYRLWCARNPGLHPFLRFDKYGRVHIIGHSLGSLLSAYILSKQPTWQPPLSQLDPCVVRQCRDRFLFNTSPLPVFVHLNQAQVIARKGRERTKDSPDDEALDRDGLFGCFAIDSLYNVFHPSDPIAYLLNPCVDAKSAKDLPPSTIPSFNASVMSGISTRFSKFLGDVMPSSFGSTPPMSRTHSPDGRPAAGRVPSGFELSGHNHILQGSRAERRFAALNPHGTLDFQLASEGSISEYGILLTFPCPQAHSSYWQDANLAAFVLVELFANQQDLARTGLVPATIARS